MKNAVDLDLPSENRDKIRDETFIFVHACLAILGEQFAFSGGAFVKSRVYSWSNKSIPVQSVRRTFEGCGFKRDEGESGRFG